MEDKTPLTRTEQYLAAIAGGDNPVPDRPLTRVEEYLDAILRQGGGSVDPDEIRQIVEDWLADHVDPGTGYVIDDTFSIPGAAPDSKLTGDELNRLNRALRVNSLTQTPLASNTVIESVGILAYVSENDLQTYSAYGLTETGWYVFARISAPAGVSVASGTTVTGADGYIKTVGAAYVDVAVRFNVAALSKAVTITWAVGKIDSYVFKATDLAVRNLDYRTTFYVYDAAPYVTWEYKPNTDAAFVGTEYYVLNSGSYVRAAVKAFDPVPADTYYTHAYVLTEDETFQDGKTYYTKEGTVYTEAEVTAGESVTANTYYEDQYTLTTDREFVGTKYYLEANGAYAQAAVKAGESCYVYYEDLYTLTEDETFQDGKTYYTLEDNVYTQAEVTPGDPVTPDTYYEHSYVQTQDDAFIEDKAYYTYNGTAYSAATVTAGEPVPDVYLVHAKVTFQGLVRNVTYKLDEVIDCGQEYILPEIEDETHGCWFELRLRHSGSFSSTLVPPEGVKIATEHTQAETAGINMVDLHYTDVAGVKVWRFLNTHSSIPA